MGFDGMKLLLFSGGLDSTALAHLLRPDQLLFVNYGQVAAEGELQAAKQIAAELELPFRSEIIDCRAIGAGDMVGGEPLSDVAPEFWPYRNQLLITIASMAYARERQLTIYLGTVQGDEIHPDGRPEFLETMQAVLNCQSNVVVQAPAREWTSTELQRRAAVPLEILAWAFSCHRSERACGLCRGCNKHFETIKLLTTEAGATVTK